MVDHEKNLILYGPPGTGKTFTSVSYAVAIIEGKEFAEVQKETPRTAVKKRFDEYVLQERIIFTTFHQSLSYEDFIEGIKPQDPNSEDEQVKYKVEDGLFKKLCTNAAFSIATTVKSEQTSKALDFSNEYDEYVDQVREQLAKQETVKISTKSGGTLFIESINDNGNIVVRHNNGALKYIVSKNRLSPISQAFDDLEKVNNIDSEFREVIGGSNATAFWAVLNAIRKSKPRSKTVIKKGFSYEDKKDAILSLTPDDYKKSDHKRFVMIIDEINRGNIAQIFGELITLIEDSKRLGKDEALDVWLPYSKKRFGVPPNVYIIGTMNTADRSVEALDAALRRRFSFQFTEPDLTQVPEVVGEIPMRSVYEAINKRITYLLDADHQIGHSYFCSKDLSEEKIKEIFKNKIIPLLKEYFFNDYAKIRVILGEKFVKTIERPSFAFDSDEAERELYLPVTLDDRFNIKEALQLTLRMQ